MLVFNRNEDESIVIEVPPSDTPTLIGVMLVRVTGTHSARIGVSAPRCVLVDREEIRVAKKKAACAAKE